jgi:hypothetical protein
MIENLRHQIDFNAAAEAAAYTVDADHVERRLQGPSDASESASSR